MQNQVFSLTLFRKYLFIYLFHSVLNSSTFTHPINYQIKGRDVCYGNEK